LQLCITVQMPKEYGGTQGQAIYIDTEGSFNVSRIEGNHFKWLSGLQIALLCVFP